MTNNTNSTLTELERISEDIEREALISLHHHCPDETKKALGLHLIEVEDAIVAVAENDPSILLNRTLGIGTSTEATPDTIKTIVDAYRKFGVNSYFLHVYLDSINEQATQQLLDSGLRKTRGWMKFQRDTSPPNDAPTTLTVRAVGTENANDFGSIVCNAFGMRETAVPLLAGLANDPRWYLYVSYEGDSPAGAGSLFVNGDKAWIEWGATNPEFRCRGSQAAIMAARIAKARELGCTHIFTETGEAVEGDPQHSCKNIMKYGFVEAKLRQNYEPDTT